MDFVLFLHSWWAYLVILVMVIAAANALVSYFSRKEYGPMDFRISLFALIVAHIQLLLGIVMYFTSPYFSAFSEMGMGKVMRDSTLRLYLVEHPLIMIIAVILITIGYSKHKKALLSRPKFRILAIFYTIATILILSRIPWNAWI